MIALAMFIIGAGFYIVSVFIAFIVNLILGFFGIAVKKYYTRNMQQNKNYIACTKVLEEKRRKQLQDSMKEEDLYIYSQLDAWAEEIAFDNKTVRECDRSIKLVYNEKTKQKLYKTKLQAMKRIANDEKNIRKTCAKYGLIAEEYLH